MGRNFLFALAAVVLLPRFAASAKPMAHHVSPHRISQNIKVDGIFAESAWQNAEPIRKFLQIQPDEGAPMTQPSEVRILYDEKNLYFGFTFFRR